MLSIKIRIWRYYWPRKIPQTRVFLMIDLLTHRGHHLGSTDVTNVCIFISLSSLRSNIFGTCHKLVVAQTDKTVLKFKDTSNLKTQTGMWR
ncbi:hypothetical protein XELAEV_18047502mg [Xenopus laevis]|uniref:Uncharacterized protein n=1 Tax=Xenopus laevis TaxID=8355 RepID=A0A974BVE1_XENLA|nr:hypothetical protein XELAEV_18047502mg [Xenopus laevis]